MTGRSRELDAKRKGEKDYRGEELDALWRRAARGASVRSDRRWRSASVAMARAERYDGGVLRALEEEETERKRRFEGEGEETYLLSPI